MTKMKLGLLAAVGCFGACAGVSLLPVVLGGVLAGGALAALEGMAGFILFLAVLGTSGYLFLQRRRPADCGCAEGAGCKAGGATCSIPERTDPQ